MDVDNRELYLSFILRNYKIIWLDQVNMTAHTERVTLIGLSHNEFSRFLIEAKKEISSRDHILDRFESWELPDADPRKVKSLLMSRARTKEEKDLVTRYINKWE